ncbi:hypothetical protein FVEG_09301 [Fusarium verticillioides 7600]|uniref:Uncharacterized protein n=1 Tax=Gibberella moniliformis (strain M3125 / FGSC 7600) TaxID=334819 RepID=W7MGF7_GIBM7|nr:hypothetical protein FVEG_09301 [Fusarium verticillioides 7600]EWG49956.1 hypothetical protein FVEG_09301 [Fusarium verticillioides 7600]RBQ74079.1 hypothetical protein FVER14953_09301 [Fusarium verticillioides]
MKVLFQQVPLLNALLQYIDKVLLQGNFKVRHLLSVKVLLQGNFKVRHLLSVKARHLLSVKVLLQGNVKVLHLLSVKVPHQDSVRDPSLQLPSLSVPLRYSARFLCLRSVQGLCQLLFPSSLDMVRLPNSQPFLAALVLPPVQEARMVRANKHRVLHDLAICLACLMAPHSLKREIHLLDHRALVLYPVTRSLGAL